MHLRITKAGTLYPRAVAEASNGTMAKGQRQRYYRSDRYVLHKGVMWRHPRAMRSQWQRTLRDLRSVETGRCCCCGPMQTLWFYVQFLAEMTDQEIIWPHHRESTMLLKLK